MELTVPEAARRAGRSPETIRRWIWKGRLPSRKVGNQHLVDSDDVDTLLGTIQPEAEGDAPVLEGEWGEWMESVRRLQEHLRARGVKLRPAADDLRESRRGR
jgi:excisionase family DNA binding protein